MPITELAEGRTSGARRAASPRNTASTRTRPDLMCGLGACPRHHRAAAGRPAPRSSRVRAFERHVREYPLSRAPEQVLGGEVRRRAARRRGKASFSVRASARARRAFLRESVCTKMRFACDATTASAIMSSRRRTGIAQERGVTAYAENARGRCSRRAPTSPRAPPRCCRRPRRRFDHTLLAKRSVILGRHQLATTSTGPHGETPPLRIGLEGTVLCVRGRGKKAAAGSEDERHRSPYLMASGLVGERPPVMGIGGATNMNS